MKIRYQGKTVELIAGERLVFLVGTYRVDLEGDCWCNCPDFDFRVRPLRKKGFRNAECKHIKQVRAILGGFFAKKISDAAGFKPAKSEEP